MNTQNGFLDNAVDDKLRLDGAENMDTEMCSYLPNDTENVCSALQDDTCGECMSFGKVERKLNI